MKARTYIAGLIALGLMAVSVHAQTTRLNSKPGNLKMRVEGTSNIHDWRVEGKLIGGYVEAGKNFPMEPGAAVEPGKVEAKGEVYIPVRSLTSRKEDGSPYNTSMDDIMYEKFKASEFTRIYFFLEELTLKEAAKGKDQPYLMDVKGKLALAGVTNVITFPIKVTPLADGRVKISGTAATKMTNFKIDPPAPKIAMGMIKTGDDVKVIFDWEVAKAKTPATAAK